MSKDPWQDAVERRDGPLPEPRIYIDNGTRADARIGSAIRPTWRRRLTTEECAQYGYVEGTEARCREDGSLIEVWRGTDTDLGLLAGPAQACPNCEGVGCGECEGVHAERHERMAAIENNKHMRLQVLAMAMTTPDGVRADPIDSVIERAVRYWHFVSSGE